MPRTSHVLSIVAISSLLSLLVLLAFSPASTPFGRAAPPHSSLRSSSDKTATEETSGWGRWLVSLRKDSLLDHSRADDNLLGDVVMEEMGNQTLRAELGRSTWHLVHTMGNSYPHAPSDDERTAMRRFIYLLSRLYPCGECAAHFQTLLRSHPPDAQLASRDDLAQYLCKLHNSVNLRLKHAIFDCNTVGDRWRCGCAGKSARPTDEKDDVAHISSETMHRESMFAADYKTYVLSLPDVERAKTV